MDVFKINDDDETCLSNVDGGPCVICEPLMVLTFISLKLTDIHVTDIFSNLPSFLTKFNTTFLGEIFRGIFSSSF